MCVIGCGSSARRPMGRPFRRRHRSGSGGDGRPAAPRQSPLRPRPDVGLSRSNSRHRRGACRTCSGRVARRARRLGFCPPAAPRRRSPCWAGGTAHVASHAARTHGRRRGSRFCARPGGRIARPTPVQPLGPGDPVPSPGEPPKTGPTTRSQASGRRRPYWVAPAAAGLLVVVSFGWLAYDRSSPRNTTRLGATAPANVVSPASRADAGGDDRPQTRKRTRPPPRIPRARRNPLPGCPWRLPRAECRSRGGRLRGRWMREPHSAWRPPRKPTAAPPSSPHPRRLPPHRRTARHRAACHPAARHRTACRRACLQRRHESPGTLSVTMRATGQTAVLHKRPTIRFRN